MARMTGRQPTSLAAARHVLGAALGAVAGGGSRCACCGASPYDFGRPTAEVLGPAFVDFDLLLDPDAPSTCEGCARMLGGRPGATPPPLRLGHFAVVDGALILPDGEQIVGWLRAPPAGLAVLGWTATRQRHASLRAGICSPPDELLIGTESCLLPWWPAEHVQLLDAVSLLRRHARQADILSGEYPPHVVAALGSRWEPAEAVVLRHRQTTRLEMVVALVRRPDLADEESDPMLGAPQRPAARLLLLLAQSSEARRDDPIRFWTDLLPRRLAASASRPTLLLAAGDLLRRLSCLPTSVEAVEAVREIEALSDLEAAQILRDWRERPALVLALTRIIRDEEAA